MAHQPLARTADAAEHPLSALILHYCAPSVARHRKQSYLRRNKLKALTRADSDKNPSRLGIGRREIGIVQHGYSRNAHLCKR